MPIATDGGAPGFATHSAEYSYFFGFPPDYDRHGTGPSVVNTTSHLALSRGIVDAFIAFIATGNPNASGGECSPSAEGEKNFALDVPLTSLLSGRFPRVAGVFGGGAGELGSECYS